MLNVLDPRPRYDNRRMYAPRVASLDGLYLGALWNGRTPGPGRSVISAIAEMVRERNGLAGVRIFEKPFLGNVAPAKLLDEVAEYADIAITGIGD